MGQFDTKSPRVKCLSCGKETIARSLREPESNYCSRVCASKSRYKTRFVGMRSSREDRSKFK